MNCDGCGKIGVVARVDKDVFYCQECAEKSMAPAMKILFEILNEHKNIVPDNKINTNKVEEECPWK